MDQDLLEAMHTSHEGPKRPWLPPLLVFVAVLVGVGVFARFVLLAPPDLEPGEVAFGKGAYALTSSGFTKVEEVPPLLAALPDELAGGDLYAGAGGAVLALGMEPVGDSNFQLEGQRLRQAIEASGGVVQDFREMKTPLGQGYVMPWTDSAGARHATFVTVHESRAVTVQVSVPAGGDPAPLIDPMVAGARATGKRPIEMPTPGTALWVTLGAVVLGAVVVGLAFRRGGRSAVGGAALGGILGLAGGVLVAIFT